MKRCTKCGESKPFSSFNRNKKKKDGYQDHCRNCQKQYKRDHYQANKQLYVQKSHERHRGIFNQVRDYKVERGCKRCDEKHPACLEFHHRDPNAKELNIAHAAKKGWSFDRILREIEKCDVLCANCHRKEHWKAQ